MDILQKYNITDNEEELLKQYFIKIYWKQKNDEKKEYRSNYYKQRKLKDEEFKKRCKEYNDKHNNYKKELRKLNKDNNNNENENEKFYKILNEKKTIVES